MRFIGRVLRDAVGLLAAGPADLMLGVGLLLVVGTLLGITGTSPLVGLGFEFLGTTLLAAGLVGRPAPDGLAAAARRLRQRLAPALGQLLAIIGLIVGLALLVGLAAALIGAIAAPGFAERLSRLGTDQAAASDPAVAAFALLIVLGLMVFTGRLLPSTGLVLDRPVGAIESLRLAWASTRGRTLACTALLVIVTAPSWLLAVFLPEAVVSFVSVLTVAFAVSVGVAAYRLLFRAGPPAPTSAAGIAS